MVIMFDIYMY